VVNVLSKDILIIEDAEDWAETFEDVLKEMGHRPLCSFKDAVDRVTHRRFDLILLDLCLDQPTFNAHCQAFLSRIHRIATGIPIVVTTEKSVVGDAVFHLREQGVCDFVFKGTFQLSQFRAIISRVLDGFNAHEGLSRKQGELLLRLVAFGPLVLNRLTEELNGCSPELLGESLYKTNLKKSGDLVELLGRKFIVRRGREHSITSEGESVVKKIFPAQFEAATRFSRKT
jgi:DNA-binding response OmpR family regulator